MVLPTYNEADNLELLIHRARAQLRGNARILVAEPVEADRGRLGPGQCYGAGVAGAELEVGDRDRSRRRPAEAAAATRRG